jgi:phosphoglycerate dehydrogenase-like enzyme
MRAIYWARINLARPPVTAALQAVPGADLTIVEKIEDLLPLLPGAEALVTYDAPVAQAQQLRAALAQPGATLRWLHLLTAGREGFEAAGMPPGVAVTWAAGAVAPAVAEHAMALLLALGRRVPEMVPLTAEGRWDRAMAGRAISLEGGTMALVGLGHVGREIARRARAFGMHVVAVMRNPQQDDMVDEVQPLSALHAVLARADAIALAIGLAPETHHLMDAAAFAACRPSALLVNVARGGVVDQAGVGGAGAEGRTAGAGLDVTTPEPLPAGDPLWGAPNLIISPHFAGGGSRMSLQRLAGGAAENLRRLIAGEELLHRIA